MSHLNCWVFLSGCGFSIASGLGKCPPLWMLPYALRHCEASPNCPIEIVYYISNGQCLWCRELLGVQTVVPALWLGGQIVKTHLRYTLVISYLGRRAGSVILNRSIILDNSLWPSWGTVSLVIQCREYNLSSRVIAMNKWDDLCNKKKGI